MQDFIADQSGVQMAAFDTFLQVSTEFYHYQFFLLEASKEGISGKLELHSHHQILIDVIVFDHIEKHNLFRVRFRDYLYENTLT